MEMKILIIEDHLTIVLLIEEFLKMLGYEDVQHSLKGSEGVELFREMVKSGNEPVVLLDFDLGDITGFDVIKQLLEIKPAAKVIMVTAHAKDEVDIQNCIASGAYDYLEKPIHLNKLKEIFQVLEIESGAVTEDPKVANTIDYLVKSSTQLSFIKIVETTHFKPEAVTEYLKKLESEKIIKSIGDIKEVSCNLCESVNTKQIFYCPNCNGSNFHKGRLIEHFDCGNVSLEKIYVDDKCPKCRKQLKAVGVDYRIMENYYTCKDCQEIFPQLSIDYLCLKCNNQFKLEQVKWKLSPGFVVVQKPKE